MFYKQFLEAKDVFNPEFVENFDYWLTTLPENNQKNITASVVSSRLGVKYMLADLMLKFAEGKGILEKYYLVKCPLLLVGPEFAKAYDGLAEKPANVTLCPTRDDLISLLKVSPVEHSLVLVKGSHGMGLEQALEAL